MVGCDDHKTGHWDWLKKLRCKIEIDPVPDSVAAKASMHDRNEWEALTATSAPLHFGFGSPPPPPADSAGSGADSPPKAPLVTLPDIRAGDATIVDSAPPETPLLELRPSVIRVACIGDSNTVGTGLDRSLSYPRRLEAKLGKNYMVQSFGRVGATAARSWTHSLC